MAIINYKIGVTGHQEFVDCASVLTCFLFVIMRALCILAHRLQEQFAVPMSKRYVHLHIVTLSVCVCMCDNVYVACVCACDSVCVIVCVTDRQADRQDKRREDKTGLKTC